MKNFDDSAWNNICNIKDIDLIDSHINSDNFCLN